MKKVNAKLIEKLDMMNNDFRQTHFSKILRVNDINTIKAVIPVLTKKPYFETIAHTLFSYLLHNKQFFDKEIFYFLRIKKPNLNELNVEDINIMLSLENGLDFLLDHIYEINYNNQYIIRALTMAVISFPNTSNETITKRSLTNRIKNDFWHNSQLSLGDYVSSSVAPQNYFNILLNFIINIPNGISKTTFFELLIKNNYPFDLNYILIAHCKNPKEYNENYDGEVIESETPCMLIRYMFQYDNIKQFIMKHFEKLLRIEENGKFSFIYDLRYFGITQKYRCLIHLYNEAIHLNADQLNLIFKNHEEKFILDYIKDHLFKYETTGTCSEVFRSDNDNLLKIAVKKYKKDSITQHFLFCPTKQLIIYDNCGNPRLYIEKQPYLSKKHNGKEMDEEDVINYLNLLAEYNMTVTDLSCLRHETRNFGFLNDYHDATLVGIDNIEDAPVWWKERPIVLYDIDLISEINVKKSLK